MSYNGSIVIQADTTIKTTAGASSATGRFTNQFVTTHTSATKVFTLTSAASSAGTTVDLSGSRKDAIGQTVTVEKLYGLYVINNSTTSSLSVFGTAGNIPILSSSAATVDLTSSGRFYHDSPRGVAVSAGGAIDTITFGGTGTGPANIGRFTLAVIGT